MFFSIILYDVYGVVKWKRPPLSEARYSAYRHFIDSTTFVLGESGGGGNRAGVAYLQKHFPPSFPNLACEHSACYSANGGLSLPLGRPPVPGI